MSSDMFSSLVEKNAEFSEPKYYKDIEKMQWSNFMKKCQCRINVACSLNNKLCDLSTCFAWQIKNL